MYNRPIFDHARMPMWAIPIHLIISLILGVILTKFVEEPVRNWLKQENKGCRNWTIFFSSIISAMGVVGLILGLLFHGHYVMSDEKFEINGQKFHFHKILSGTTKANAEKICQESGTFLFEPRDATINNEVYQQMHKLTNYGYWLNIERNDTEHEYFKYGSDNGDLGWENWQENEPNNFGNSDERCVGVDLEFWHIRWRQKWFDSGCYIRMAVLCQEDQKLKVAEDVEITTNGTTYKFKPSTSGTLEEARSVCSADGMMLFEPRDQASYDAVLEKARTTGQDLIWMNVKQDNQTDKTKQRKFRYMSDNTEVVWSDWPPHKPGLVGKWHGEDVPLEKRDLCVQATQVQWTGDWLRGEVNRYSPWRPVWNDLNCNKIGQIVCQSKKIKTTNCKKIMEVKYKCVPHQ